MRGSDHASLLYVTPVPVSVLRFRPSVRPGSLFIIGMRGSGKSTLGIAAARALGYRFVDADDCIAKRCPGGSIKDLVAKVGAD